MNANEREKLPPPPCCRVCGECQTTVSPTGVSRSVCLKDFPMHPGCTGGTPRTPSVMDEVTG